MTQLDVPDGPKMLRETLCVAQNTIAHSPYDDGRKEKHIVRLSRLIAECDRHRPLGPDGKHGNRHTLTCGCEDCGHSLHTTPDAELRRIERSIREAARHQDDDSRALGMMDAADMLRDTRLGDQ